MTGVSYTSLTSLVRVGYRNNELSAIWDYGKLHEDLEVTRALDTSSRPKPKTVQHDVGLEAGFNIAVYMTYWTIPDIRTTLERWVFILSFHRVLLSQITNQCPVGPQGKLLRRNIAVAT